MVNFSSFRRSGVSLRSRTKSLTKSYAAAADKAMAENWNNGLISDEEYVSYLNTEVAERAWLTPSQKVANKIKVDEVQDRIVETALNDAYKNGTVSIAEYINYKKEKLKGMTEGSLAYRNLQQDIYELEDKQKAEVEAENKRMRNLQYSADLLAISEWSGDTLGKAQGKVLALEGLIKDMEENGDTVDDGGLPTKEYLSAQTRLNNAIENAKDLFRQRDQLRQELALNLSNLDTIPDLEAKRAIAEQMLQEAIDDQDEIRYLRLANKIASIDDSLRNAYETEYERSLGQAEKSEKERIRLELRQLDEDMEELEQKYQVGEIDSAEYLGSKLELYLGNAAGGRGYRQVLEDKMNSGAYTDTERYNAQQKLGGMVEEVEDTANLALMGQRGLVQDVLVLDKETGRQTRKPKWIDPSNVIDLTDPSAPLNLEDVFEEQGSFKGIYIKDAQGNLRPAELRGAGAEAIKRAIETGASYTVGDLFKTGHLTVSTFDPKLGYIESRYNNDSGRWETVQLVDGKELVVPQMSGGKAPFGSVMPYRPEGMSRVEAVKVKTTTDQALPVEQRASKITTDMQPAPALTQKATEIVKTPEYKAETEKQIARTWGQDIEPKPVTKYEPEVKYEVPDMPTYEETVKSMGIKEKAQPTQKAEEIMATMPYQQAVQEQAQKAVEAGVPWGSTLAGYQEQRRKKKEKEDRGIFGKVKGFFGW